MQTFLPSTSFEQSAKWLDAARLGKQRVEVLQILKALTNPSYGWQNHPAVNMWRGYEHTLICYGLAICNEWTAMGYKDTCATRILNMGCTAWPCDVAFHPNWLTEEFASNHRSILLGKVLETHEQAAKLWFDIATADDDDILKLRRVDKKVNKTREVLSWYQSFNWQEKPAKRVNGKWPYLWPEAV